MSLSMSAHGRKFEVCRHHRCRISACTMMQGAFMGGCRVPSGPRGCAHSSCCTPVGLSDWELIWQENMCVELFGEYLPEIRRFCNTNSIVARAWQSSCAPLSGLSPSTWSLKLVRSSNNPWSVRTALKDLQPPHSWPRRRHPCKCQCVVTPVLLRFAFSAYPPPDS